MALINIEIISLWEIGHWSTSISLNLEIEYWSHKDIIPLWEIVRWSIRNSAHTKDSALINKDIFQLWEIGH